MRINEVNDYLNTLSIGKYVLTKVVYNEGVNRFYTFTPLFEAEVVDTKSSTVVK